MTGKIPLRGTPEWKVYWAKRHTINQLELIYQDWPKQFDNTRSCMLYDINVLRGEMGFPLRPQGWKK